MIVKRDGRVRERIRRAVERHVREFGCVPTNREIAARCGLTITRQSIQSHLRELADRGVLQLTTDSNKSRRLVTKEGRLLQKVASVLLTNEDPDVAAVKAGMPPWVGRVLRNLVQFA